DGLAVHDDFVVQMGTGTPAGAPQIADPLSFFHVIARVDMPFAQVKVTGFDSPSVIDDNVVALRAVPGGFDHLAVGCGVHRVAHFAAQVDARVEGEPSGERIAPHAE